MNLNLLCKVKGGSHAYGLSTPQSDLDWRGVFVNTEVKHLVGLSKFEHQITQNETKDESFTELRHFFNLLKQANTQAIELLFYEPPEMQEVTKEWLMIQELRSNLVDTEKLFSCLRGYMQSELRLANGERTGKLGGKRKEAIDKYGFSPKNFVQLFRLSWAGQVYFNKGYFPVNVMKEDRCFGEWLMEIKTKPENFEIEELNSYALSYENKLKGEFQYKRVTTSFNESLADNLCLKIYGPMICKAYHLL